MGKKIKIEVWSDFVCPFCYIGKRRLETALDKFEYKDEVELVFKSYELDPLAKKKYDENINQIIAKKYGITVEQAKKSNEQIVAQAKELGLNYNFEDLIPTNTFDAHRLAHYAKSEGKMNELTERILKAYFVDSLNISEHNVLAGLAGEAGIDTQKALEVLKSDSYTSEVRKDEEDASRLKISGVPYFVINSKYSINGAQREELFFEVLEKVKNEELSEQKLNSLSEKRQDSNSGKCANGVCQI